MHRRCSNRLPGWAFPETRSLKPDDSLVRTSSPTYQMCHASGEEVCTNNVRAVLGQGNCGTWLPRDPCISTLLSARCSSCCHRGGETPLQDCKPFLQQDVPSQYDTCTCLPSQPSPMLSQPFLCGRSVLKRCNSGQTDHQFRRLKKKVYRSILHVQPKVTCQSDMEREGVGRGGRRRRRRGRSFFFSVRRRRRGQHCIDYNTTSARLSVLWVQHPAPQGSGEKGLLLSRNTLN